MTRARCRGFRFSKPVIRNAVWLNARFTLSLLDVEDALEHGLRAKRLVMAGDEALEEFAAFEAALVADLAPAE